MSYKTWNKAQLVSTIYYPDGETTFASHDCELTTAVTIDIQTPHKIKGGINRRNSIMLTLPPTFNYVIAVPALSVTAAFLRSLQAAGIMFNMEVYDKANTGEFELEKEILYGCTIDKRLTNIVVGEMVVLRYSGSALRWSFAKEGTDMSGNSAASTNSDMFGDGSPSSVDPLGGW